MKYSILSSIAGWLTALWVVYGAHHVYNTFVAPGFSLPAVKYPAMFALCSFLSLATGHISMATQLMIYNTNTSDNASNFKKGLTHNLVVALMTLSAILMAHGIRLLFG